MQIIGNQLAHNGLFLFQADHQLDLFRFASLVDEFSLRACLIATGHEYKWLKEIKEFGFPLVLPLSFPELGSLEEDPEGLEVPIATLRHWDRAPSGPFWFEQAGISFALTSRGLENINQFRKMLGIALDRGLSPKAARAALTTVPASILGCGDRLGSVESGRIAHFIISDGDPLVPATQIESLWLETRMYYLEKPKDDGDPDNTKTVNNNGNENNKIGPRSNVSSFADKPQPPADNRGPIIQPEKILIKNGMIWTCGPEGIIDNSDLLIENGVIKRVGIELEASPNTLIVDASGKHITPGLIDKHSHAYLTGPVNESTFSSTAEVRISDVIDSESRNIYLHLASGVTSSNLLHGSANTIGGQTAVVKLRWGEPPQGLLFKEAPICIKFALGENVKQSNWGDNYKKRFPQTRMGVEQFIRERFIAARNYQAQQTRIEQQKNKRNVARPVRRDLELEALVQVISGEMPIQCHGYRVDEMLMLMKLAEEYGITIQSFEHGLEGYKIAKELAEHGVGMAIFTDWWAYKFEVYDAIPYNGRLLWENGVLVALKSDSSELARRLNHEAAKMVKYGEISDEQALQLVTINPAKMLGIDTWTGSIEVGKQADIVIWNDNPLSMKARCEQTWIEGKKYFDVNHDELLRQRLVAEHAALIKLAQSPDVTASQDQ
ncbi:amidohydrolase family protein [candidate division CSSED10-310 bacterium]|uniref:Amidohydrolase family protein n=1 Tax=candidate division CSSED10-310 bacterium TaxID=2855610 RepID=A0ABV6Z103_UNCC1